MKNFLAVGYLRHCNDQKITAPLRVMGFHLVPQSLWFSIGLPKQEPKTRPLAQLVFGIFGGMKIKKGTKIYNVRVSVRAAKYLLRFESIHIPTKGRKLRSSLGNKTI